LILDELFLHPFDLQKIAIKNVLSRWMI